MYKPKYHKGYVEDSGILSSSSEITISDNGEESEDICDNFRTSSPEDDTSQMSSQKNLKKKIKKTKVPSPELSHTETETDTESESNENIDDVSVSMISGDDEYKYIRLTRDDFQIIIMKSNSYINATNICKNAQKKFKTWRKKFQTTIDQMNEMIEPMIKVKSSVQEIKGMYIHPVLLHHLALWCSSEFAVDAQVCFEQWIEIKNDIQNKRIICPGCIQRKKDKENMICQELNHNLDVTMDPPNRNNYSSVNIMTESDIIIIKSYEDWKNGFTQVLIYGMDYPDHTRIMYLFDVPKENDIKSIRKICRKVSIQVMIYDYK